MGKLINIDNGGTLTDIWVLDGGQSYHTKTLTTPHDLSRCFFDGLRKVSRLIYGEEKLAELLHSTDHIRYSTTMGTNALVERKGPRIGLVVSSGIGAEAFRATKTEGELFDAIIGPRFTGFDTAATGATYSRAVVVAVNELVARGAQRIVVSFSEEDYLMQERRFQREALRMFPQHLLGAIPLLFAGSLAGDANLTRRTWTAIYNSFLHPAMERFLYHAENLLKPYRSRNPLLIYRNDGYSGRVAKTIALGTYSSGPRGGMESSRAYADAYGFDRLLSFDVGGTTTDIGVVENGGIRERAHGEVVGIACSHALSDIVSVGVGGGSIFRTAQGRIKVGPDSVGGAPGPACFGMGGTQATITDALVVMGLLDPATYFGGAMTLDLERARAAVMTHVAEPLGLSLPQAVHTMQKAWAAGIAREIERYAPMTPETVIAAFGGGGPLAAIAVAEALGIRTVLVPRLAAVFSAHGIGFSDIGHRVEQRVSSKDRASLETVVSELRGRVLRDMFSEGFEADQCRLEAWATAGDQTCSLDPQAPVWPAWPGIEEISVGVRASKPIPHAAIRGPVDLPSREPEIHGRRRLLRADGTFLELPVIRSEDQLPGTKGQGPVVIEETYWTCQVLPGWSFEFTANGDLLFQRIG